MKCSLLLLPSPKLWGAGWASGQEVLGVGLGGRVVLDPQLPAWNCTALGNELNWSESWDGSEGDGVSTEPCCLFSCSIIPAPNFSSNPWRNCLGTAPFLRLCLCPQRGTGAGGRALGWLSVGWREKPWLRAVFGGVQGVSRLSRGEVYGR